MDLRSHEGGASARTAAPPPPTLRSVDRDPHRRGRAACARPLTAEIHSRSTGFGDRLSASVHELERNVRSHVRLECATARSGAEDHERTRHSVAPPTLTIEIHSVASEFGHEISTPRYASRSIADPRVPLECAAPPHSRATRARRPEIRTRQASPAIGRRHSPFESTAFLVVQGAVVHTLHRAHRWKAQRGE